MGKSKLLISDLESNVIKMKNLILFVEHLIIWTQILLKKISTMGKLLMFGLLELFYFYWLPENFLSLLNMKAICLEKYKMQNINILEIIGRDKLI